MKDSKDGDSAHSDFWRVAPDGLTYLLRGYLEDCEPAKVDPGQFLWVQTPIWGIGECLLHAQRLSQALSTESASILVRFEWEGLSGRTLRYWNADKQETTWFDRARKTCRQDKACSPFLKVSADDISDNLPEIVMVLTKDLYLAFNLHEVEMRVIQKELSNLRQRSSL